MKIWCFSDLHIDVNKVPFEIKERPDYDVLVIPGDIREDMVKSVKWIEEMKLDDKPVIFVGGNHEFYREKRDTCLNKAIEYAGQNDNITILQDSNIEIDGVLFVGATLWTDYRIFGEACFSQAMMWAESSMNDHRLIRLASQGYRRWLPKDAELEHRFSRAYIHMVLDQPWDGPRVVVTHHAPSFKSVPERYTYDLLTAAFASDLEHEVDRVSVWFHGHIHTAQDYTLGDGRVVCNPRGYIGHDIDIGFDPLKVVEI